MILRRPKSIVTVEKSALQKIAAMVPPKPAHLIERAAVASNSPTFDVVSWIAKHKLPVVMEKPWRDGRIWLLNPCPWDESHTNMAAFITQGGNGAIGAGCHHNGCAGRGWHELRDLVEPGWRVRPLREPVVTSPPTISPAIARCYQQINNRPRPTPVTAICPRLPKSFRKTKSGYQTAAPFRGNFQPHSLKLVTQDTCVSAG